MDYLLYVFPFFFLFYAVFYLIIAFKAMIKNKPSIINSKWLYVIIAFSLLPSAIYAIINLLKFGFDGLSGLIFLTMPIFLIILFIFYYFIMKGYSIYCVNDTDFRNSIIFSLDDNSIKFEEKMNRIELIELNNELNISFTAWIGTGMIKLKNKKDKIIYIKIVDGIKQYFKERHIESKKTMAIFYLIFGIIFIIFSVGFTLFVINMSQYFGNS